MSLITGIHVPCVTSIVELVRMLGRHLMQSPLFQTDGEIRPPYEDAVAFGLLAQLCD
jgi:hypothetical protein